MTQLSGSPFGFNKIINPYLLSSGHNLMRKRRRKQTMQASFFTLQTLLLMKWFSRACLLSSPDIQFYFPRLCLNVGDMREMLIWGDARSAGKRGRKSKELRQDQTSSEDDATSERVEESSPSGANAHRSDAAVIRVGIQLSDATVCAKPVRRRWETPSLSRSHSLFQQQGWEDDSRDRLRTSFQTDKNTFNGVSTTMTEHTTDGCLQI